MTVRLLVIGDGQMGRAVSLLAPERGCHLVGMLGPGDMSGGLRSGIADVVIEFTQPTAAPGNIRACLVARLPVVSGTTGWDAEFDSTAAEAKRTGGALLHSPNFSLGVHVFQQLVELAARLASSAGFEPHLVETHHARKLDAPSGTATQLARVARKAGARDVPTTSVRVGHVPGTHELLLDAPFEQIRLVHEARDRRVFADGAIAASKWLIGRKGVFTFEDYAGSLG